MAKEDAAKEKEAAETRGGSQAKQAEKEARALAKAEIKRLSRLHLAEW